MRVRYFLVHETQQSRIVSVQSQAQLDPDLKQGRTQSLSLHFFCPKPPRVGQTLGDDAG